MILVNDLKKIIAHRGLSQRKLAIMLGMSDKTFYSKMQKGVFNINEVEAIIEILHIDEPYKIFFAN
ncbi:MAG: helix-turn-helix transcriptional regulator [Bacillota bacterium]|nr:helix-turn-helix transcriptional regulator [Bacillota bacterium]